MKNEKNTASADVEVVSKSEERRIFILLAVLMGPILSVVLVGGYGFLIWMSQLLLGPPSH